MAFLTGLTRNGGHWSNSGPPAPVLAASFFLAGLGTVMLGPLLPVLLREWSLSDQDGGLLLLAKFTGAFVGGVSISRRLRLGILAGHALTGVSLCAFAVSHRPAQALPALFFLGLGLGLIIASTNILAGRRWSAHTGSALALMNFFWSLGAVLTGVLAAALLPHYGWRGPTFGLAGLFFAIGLLNLLTAQVETTPDRAASPPEALSPLPPRRAALHGSQLFLYGGLETCLTAWLTTFALRFAGGHLLGGQSGFVVLWAALTGGRALASLAMRRWSEPAVQRSSLTLCFLLIGVLAASHTAAGLSFTCVLLGLALAPVFPSTFALLLQDHAAPRVAGSLLAISGLGAALFPWLMGVVSTHFGSLRLAMAVPAALVPLMLILSFARVPKRDGFSTPIT